MMLVSVVTRTRNRPRLLKRAAHSVLAARIDGLEWVIVEDGTTTTAETEAIVASAQSEGLTARLVCSGGKGRSAAANLGLQESAGTFVHIHDDDDTVHPDFYKVTTGFLDGNSRYKGVRTMCYRITEEIQQEGVRTISRKRHYPERRQVSLFAAAEVFAYPPIATVLDRQTLLDMGGFNTDLDVAEDYELLLRFLLRADMGTIDDYLASVHQRPKTDRDRAYANSPISYSFAEEDALFRNRMLRNDINKNRVGLGWLLVMGSLRRQNRTLLDFLDAARRRIGL